MKIYHVAVLVCLHWKRQKTDTAIRRFCDMGRDGFFYVRKRAVHRRGGISRAAVSAVFGVIAQLERELGLTPSIFYRRVRAYENSTE